MARRPPPVFFDCFALVVASAVLIAGYITGHDWIIGMVSLCAIRAGMSGAKLGLFGALGASQSDRDASQSDRPPPSDNDGSGPPAGSGGGRSARAPEPPPPPPTSAVLAIVRGLRMQRPALVAVVGVALLLVAAGFR